MKLLTADNLGIYQNERPICVPCLMFLLRDEFDAEFLSHLRVHQRLCCFCFKKKEIQNSLMRISAETLAEVQLVHEMHYAAYLEKRRADLMKAKRRKS